MSRIPFVAAVVGALLIGGATTGGTHASWVQSQQLSSSSVSSGSMNFSLGAPSTLASLNSTAGSEGSATFVATDTGVGKNLVQRITATVATTPTGVTAYVAAGSTCAGITSTSDFADKRPSDVVRTQSFCVRVLSSTTAVSGNVTVNVASAQRPAGWSVATKTVTIPVTIAAATPDAPLPVCFTTSSASASNLTFTWNGLAGDKFELLRKRQAESTFSSLFTGSTQTSYSQAATLSDQGEAITYKLRVTRNNLTSVDSKLLTLTRSGNSANYNCVVQ